MDPSQALDTATNWLAALESSKDAEAFASLFLPTGWMRDILCFSWDFRSLAGRPNIAKFLASDGRFTNARLHTFELDPNTTIGPPSTFPVPGNASAQGVSAAFKFKITAPPATGRGYVRLLPTAEGDWQAFTLFLSMYSLDGHQEPAERPWGFAGRSWEAIRAQSLAAVEQDPTVLIVGGGQAGLMCAARFGQMGLRTLVIEKRARVGDVWRERYPTLSLHTSAHHCSILYQPWPKTFPKFLPKQKVADYLEAYAIGQDINLWTASSVLPTPAYDDGTGRWSVDVDHAGTRVTLHPRHIVMCTGNGKARIPKWEGMESFAGTLYHSDQHKGAAPFAGKRVIVVGACNAGADMAQDFALNGASEVTMVQRGATCVISVNTVDKAIFSVTFAEKFDIDDADFVNHSMPQALALKLAAGGGTARLKALDQQLHEGLTKAGFKLTWELTPGGGEVGLLGFFFERTAAGSMVDVGCGQLIIDGKVKVKQGVEVDRVEPTGLVFKDGTKIDADVIVLATGNEPIMANATDLFGEDLKDKIGEHIWGLDAEGELRNCYRPTGAPGLWFAPGAFQHSRFFSRHLGLQILAEELGLK